MRPGRLRPPEQWLADAEEATELADEAGDLHLRVAIRAIGAYPHLIIGDFDGFEAELDEMIELIDGDRTIGAGVLVGSPLAYAYMSKGMALRERARFEEAEDSSQKALRIADGGRRPRDGLLGQEQPRPAPRACAATSRRGWSSPGAASSRPSGWATSFRGRSPPPTSPPSS